MRKRCQHTGPLGPCNQFAIDESDYCERHSKEKQRKVNYLLTDPELRKKYAHHSRAENLETIRQEVVLLRALINERLNLARTDAEKISAFNVIHPALSTLNKMVESLSKLERSSGVVLEKEAIRNLGNQIIDILIDELKDIPNRDSVIDRIAHKIAKAIADAQNTD